MAHASLNLYGITSLGCALRGIGLADTETPKATQLTFISFTQGLCDAIQQIFTTVSVCFLVS